MKIYRVYAQCVTKVHPVKEISKDDLREEIEDAAVDYFNIASTEFLKDEEGEISEETFDLAYQAIASLLTKDWSKYRRLDRGDYMIVEAQEEPSRPNICGYPDYSEEEILSEMKEV